MTRSSFVVEHPTMATFRALNYTPEVERLRRSVANGRGIPLRRLVRSMGPAYGTVFTRLDCKEPHGVELLSQSDMFAFEPVGRRIRIDSMPRPEDHRIRRLQVLIAGAGTLGQNELYGRVIIADGRLTDKFVGPDAMVLTFEEEGGDESLFAYAFLCTAAGVRGVRATSYGTKVLRFRADLLGDLPIPRVNATTQSRVAALVRATVEQRERAKQEIGAARAPIEQLPAMQEALELCGDRRRRASTWSGNLPTLIAWNYVSTGGALARLAQEWNGRLGDVLVEDGLFNGPRFVRTSCEPPYGVVLLSQRDVFLARSQPQRIVRPPIDERALFASEQTLLVASHGQMEEGNLFGRVELAAHGAYQYAIAQDLLRIVPRPEYHALSYAFLSTRVGLRLLQSVAVGTSIPVMRLDLIAGLPFPDVDFALKQRIEEHVNAAIEARRNAQAAEAEAIRIIEQEVVPEWLA